MVMALESAYLSLDLVSPIEYTAGQELQFTLHFSVPEIAHGKRKYYIMCAFYTKDLAYISDTLFSIYVPLGAEYGIASIEYTTVWELRSEGSVDLPCRFILGRSDSVLGLFLFKMEGDAPVLGVDEDISSISLELVSPAPTWPWESIGIVIIPAVMLSMVGFMMYDIIKD